jgi:hypothetical protein
MREINKIIINADDFGSSDLVNGAVLRSFQRFLVTSTSLLVNMPGFENAIGLIQQHVCFSDRVGVRLNFSEGTSLTSAIRSCGRFCNASGDFILNGGHRLWMLSIDEKKALYDEMKAQLEKALMAGVRPTHLDMHHSLHRQWPVACLMASVGREYGIHRIRFFRNLGPHMLGMKGIYRQWFNLLIWKYTGVSGPDHSGNVEDLLRLPAKRRPMNKYIEIAVRPTVDEYGELIDSSGKGLQLKLRPVIDHRHTIAYADLPLRSEGTGLVNIINKLIFPPLPGRGVMEH